MGWSYTSLRTLCPSCGWTATQKYHFQPEEKRRSSCGDYEKRKERCDVRDKRIVRNDNKGYNASVIVVHTKCTDKEKVFGLFYRQNVIDYRQKMNF